MARKVILDVDPGIDDAVAITMALFDAELDVVAVTAVGGNVSPHQATRNVQAVIEQLDPPRLPRLGAASEPDGGLPADSQHVFGHDGLGNTNYEVSQLHNAHPSEKVLVEEVRAAPEDVTVVALGPLTNIARAMARDPEWSNQVGQLIIMGGTVTSPGNITPAAEFNIFCDPTAARHVMQAPMTKTLVPLDVSEQIVFDYDLLDKLPSETTAAGRFLRQILPFAFRSHRQLFGHEGIFLHDAVALTMVRHPEWFTTENMSVDVETQGQLTRGATVFDRRRPRKWRPNVEAATQVEAEEVADWVIRCLQQAGSD